MPRKNNTYEGKLKFCTQCTAIIPEARRETRDTCGNPKCDERRHRPRRDVWATDIQSPLWSENREEK